jgi:LPXTG-motif cell wall-anchored protein
MTVTADVPDGWCETPSITLEEVKDESSSDSSYSEYKFYDTYKVSASDGWTETISGLPVNGYEGDDFVVYDYTVRETTELEDYAVSYSGTSDDVVITNTKLNKKRITVIKKWLDNLGKDTTSAGASEIKFGLWRKAEPIKSVTITPLITETNMLPDKSESNTFAIGSRVKLNVYVGYVGHKPDITIQGVSADDITWDSSSGIYTYEFVVSGDTSNIIGKVDSTPFDSAYVQLELVSPPSDSGEALVIPDEQIGEYTITADNNWSTVVDVTSLESTGVYTKEDGTAVMVNYTYCIKEEDTNGYSVKYTYNGNEPCDACVFSLNEVNENDTVTIQNKAESQPITLPSTGGIGTTIYTMAGALLVVCAVCCLYIKTKRNKI